MSAVPEQDVSRVQGNGHPTARRDVPMADPGTPPDLVPRAGTDAYERTSCSSIYLLEVPGSGDLKQVDDKLPVDLSESLEKLGAFDRPAEGVILTTEQSWYLKGVTRGQLIHSLALAPGEATRVAVVDWSR
jgi:hypothetical protein